MREIRPAQLGDLEVVARWLRNSADCELWAGHRVSFPVALEGLPRAIEWDQSDSWVVTHDSAVAGFGQLVPKLRGRVHLARLICDPDQRRRGLGRLLTARLLETALSRQPTAISLNVSPENVPALHLYRSLGFVAAARAPDERESHSAYMEHTP